MQGQRVFHQILDESAYGGVSAVAHHDDLVEFQALDGSGLEFHDSGELFRHQEVGGGVGRTGCLYNLPETAGLPGQHGFNGGGFLDIILIGGLLFLAFKFFSRRRAATQGAGQPNAGGFDSLRSTPGSDSTHQRTAAPQSGKGGFDWEALTTPSSGQQPLYQDEPKKPAGFDEEEFLRGAKAAYTRLNNAWDKRDLSDIAQFSTPAFQKEIQQQAAEDKTPGNTEIMLVNASLLSVDTVGDEQIAQVYFNVLLREDPSQEAPIDVREIWHFVRPASGDGTWKLDGIQQVENV